ncbi:MAG TPA: hypothetical protein VN833_05275 [Candidatus Acidoferrales bacterium]|nr:hypothetical protein [Candidatus Acidoferrales bacterium]
MFGIPPSEERVIHQRVLHIDDNSGGGIDAGQLLNGQNCFEEFGSAAAVLFGDFDSHQTELKKFMDEGFFEDSFLVHLFDQGADFVVGKLTDVIAEKDFVFGERG